MGDSSSESNFSLIQSESGMSSMTVLDKHLSGIDPSDEWL